ncbi:RND transporter [Rhodobaculum claviforme]|uniref:RND transporter n=1 Tax=Rhodobaculum claviforme TaxID=1549854 RepID=A0A934WHS6_9RHOB|nr:RND transporter [Rhodobaculum claviforme]
MGGVGGGALALAGLTWAFWPDPVAVDLAEVVVAPMQVTVTAEGVSRVREPYLVTAPIGGVAERAPVAVGDAVTRNETVVARIQPADPQLLDVRARAEAEAGTREARAAVAMAEAVLARADVDLRHAAAALARNRALAARGIIPQRMLEDSEQGVEAARAGLEAAQSELLMRGAMLARAEAALLGPGALEIAPNGCCAEVRAPHSGTVLWLEGESARLVAPGEVLMGIGDLSDMEVEVDLLSTDAVRLAPGAAAVIERWGGEGLLEARVRRIDPRGFTRVSALGIEEQRVRVLLDLLSPPEARPRLGDAFRVFARMVIWETEATLQVPIGALIRQGGDWAVFRLRDGRAELVRVELGRRTQDSAQVLAGLQAGDRVVAFPGDRIRDTTRVVAR